MSDAPIYLHAYDPNLQDEALVLAALRSGRLMRGEFGPELEQRVATLCGVTDAVAVSTAGAAMLLLARALGLRHGDEAIVSPLAPVYVAEALTLSGVRLVMVDIDPVTLNLDAALVEKAWTLRTKAVVFSHTFGNPHGIDAVARVAARHETPLIEECGEALGTTLRGRSAGSFGRVAVVSLGAASAVWSGSGAVVVSDDARLGADLRAMRAGYTGPAAPSTSAAIEGLSELTAAVAVGQLRRLDDLRVRRTALAEAYLRRLIDVRGVVVPTVSEDAAMLWPGMVCRLDAAYSDMERDRVLKGMRNHDVEALSPRRCLHRYPGAAEAVRCDPVPLIAESVAKRLIRLPFHTGMTLREVDLITQTLALMISRENLARGG